MKNNKKLIRLLSILITLFVVFYPVGISFGQSISMDGRESSPIHIDPVATCSACREIVAAQIYYKLQASGKSLSGSSDSELNGIINVLSKVSENFGKMKITVDVVRQLCSKNESIYKKYRSFNDYYNKRARLFPDPEKDQPSPTPTPFASSPLSSPISVAYKISIEEKKFLGRQNSENGKTHIIAGVEIDHSGNPIYVATIGNPYDIYRGNSAQDLIATLIKHGNKKKTETIYIVPIGNSSLKKTNFIKKVEEVIKNNKEEINIGILEKVDNEKISDILFLQTGFKEKEVSNIDYPRQISSGIYKNWFGTSVKFTKAKKSGQLDIYAKTKELFVDFTGRLKKNLKQRSARESLARVVNKSRAELKMMPGGYNNKDLVLKWTEEIGPSQFVIRYTKLQLAS